MSKQNNQAPFSAHPLFPAIIALWFATLFGMGFFVLPASLLERLTAMTGLPSVFPAAAAPLGLTARLLISASAAVAGALGGYTLGRVLAQQGTPSRKAKRVRQPKAEPVEETVHVRRRPILAKQELGSPALDTPPAPPPLPVAQESEPALEEEPVAAEAEPFRVDTELADWEEVEPEEPDAAYEALFTRQEDLREDALEVSEEAELAEEAEPAGEEEPALAMPEPELDAMPEQEQEQEQEDASDQAPETPADKEPEALHPVPLPTDHKVPLDQLGMVELTERLGANVQDRIKRGAPPPAGLAAALRPSPPEPDPTAAPAPVDTAPQADRPAKKPVSLDPPVSGDQTEPDTPEPALGEDMPAMEADQSLLASSVPDAASMTRALRGAAMSFDGYDEEADEEEDDEEWEDYEEEDESPASSQRGYSSLLDVKPSFRPTPDPMIFDEAEPEPDALPARHFAPESAAPFGDEGDSPENAADNGQAEALHARPSREEEEQALRNALASLQKISGAA